MASIVISGDTSGAVTLSAPAISGTTTLTLPTTSGTLVVTGGAQTVQFAAGSAAAPSITFTGDTNTGIFSPAADTIAFTEGGVESMRIDSSGNVGIGITNPAKRLSVQNATNSTTVGTNAVMTIQAGSSVNSVAEIGFAYNGWSQTNPLCTIGYQITSNAGVGLGAITFATRNVTTDTAPTERMRINSVGDVSIQGTPGYVASGIKLAVEQPSGIFGVSSAIQRWSYANFSIVDLYLDGSANPVFNTDAQSTWNPPATMIWQFRGTERMRLNANGNLLLATTFDGFNARQTIVFSASGSSLRGMAIQGQGGTGQEFIGFVNSGGGGAGSITQNSGGGTNYNTTSDYRLKENIAPMTGALDTVAQLKPVTYNWKADGSSGQGFIAHELQAVVPDAVTGEKDAVNEDGSIKAQQMDASFLVATLTAAIQELNAKVEAQAAEIAALKGAN